MGGCVRGRWWDPQEAEGLSGIFSFLVAMAHVKSGNNTAPEEEHFITRSLKNLGPDPLLEKSFGSEIFKVLLENALVLKEKNARNTRQDMIKYRNYGTINTCSRSSSERGDQ